MTRDWRYDYLDPDNAAYFSNPRAEMAPEDYAPTTHWTDYADADDDVLPDEDDDGDDD